MSRAEEDELEELEDEVDEEEAADDPDEAEPDSGARRGSFVAGIAMGALLGAAVALLFAPASGHVTRRRLRRKLDHARELASDGLDELRQRAKREIRRRVEAAEKSLKV